MDLFSKLSEIYKEHETRVETIDDIDYFVIVNPFWDGNILISNEDLDGITFFFSFQHAHFDYSDDINENINYLIEYINGFLDRKQVVVEFFQESTAIGGGSRYLGDMDMSSGESLLKSFAGDNIMFYESVYNNAKGFACRCSIRGWNDADSKDIDFIL